MAKDSRTGPVAKGQIEVLETAANGESVSEAFSVLFEIVEMQFPGMHVSAFLLDKNHERLRLKVSPSFPSELLSLLRSWEATNVSSPPATAMIRREPVFVADINQTDGGSDAPPREQHDIESAWIFPLIDSSGELQGALGLHGRSTVWPDGVQIKALENVARLVAIAMASYQTKKALRKREVEIRQLYNSVQDVIFEIRVDPDESFSFANVNRSFLEVTGLSEDEVIGKLVNQVIPEPSYSLVVEKYRQAIRDERTISWQEKTPYPSGVKTGEVSVSPIFDSEGCCTMLIGSVHDLTERKHIEDRLRKSEETFRLLFETSRDGIIVMTENRECVRANSAAVAMFGCKDEAEFLAVHASQRNPEFQANGQSSDDYAENIIEYLDSNGSRYYEWLYRRVDGSEFFAEIMPARMMQDGQPMIHLTIRDITERVVTQARLGRITKIYDALGQCNQAIIHCEDENELLNKVCRIAVEYGGMRLAWVGMLDASTQLLKPMALYGDGYSYVGGIEVSTDAGKATGKGPGGRAFREKRAIWCQDFMNDPSLAAWHERGREYGWSSVAGLPLFRNGDVVGVFILYSGVANAFDDEEQGLLKRMAEEISFGLSHMQGNREREEERKQLSMLSQVVEQSPNVVMITNGKGLIEYVNPAFERLTGYESKEVCGRDSQLLKSGGMLSSAFEQLRTSLKRGEAWQGEVITRKKDGAEVIAVAHVGPLYTEEDRVSRYLCVAEDVTEYRNTERRVEYLVNYDELTGLPSRVQLQQQFGHAMNAARRGGGNLALIFVDLDQFKNINNTLGHSVGDAVLKEIANQLKDVLRKEDVLCRLGGDKFIVMLPQCGPDKAAKVAENILAAISVPRTIKQHEFVLTGSLGIAVFPQDGSDLETLSKNADMAMFLAKQERRGCYRFYTEEMQTRNARTLLLVGEMRHAIAKEQFHIHYQPFVSRGRVIGAEALLRWDNPTLGSVSPVEFIPAAEEFGLIVDIGEWVLHKAAQQARAWLDAGMQLSSMAVNLSPMQFRDEKLSQTVVKVLQETQLPPEVLELEITESTAMLNPDLAVSLTKGLNMLGIRFAIDDFGTGYSSLSYLKKFHLHKLKIDRTFVRDLLADAEDQAIVSTIIDMARNLGLVVIAEGVENEEQCRFLTEQGCAEMQGFYFSKPLPASECESFIRDWNARHTG